MKKITLIATFLWLLIGYSYGQKDHVQTATIKGRGNAMDTIIRKKTELSFGKKFTNNYKKDASAVQQLRPYLVSDIVDPTNQSHPVYLQHIKEARQNLQLAKRELLELMKIFPSYRERMAKVNINNEDDLNSLTFTHLPVYYITPNITYLKSGENISKYYNLWKGGLKYLMLRNNKPIGFLDFYASNAPTGAKIYFTKIFPQETESYNQIIKLGKKPIALVQSVYTLHPKKIGGHVQLFGFAEQGHLVFSYYEERPVQQVGPDGRLTPNRCFQKEYTIETVESFFSGSNNSSLINSWLENAVKSLKNSPIKR